MLRRLKTDVDFVIPPKREVVVYAQLSTSQQEMYRCILNKTIAQLVKAPSETPVCSLGIWRFALLGGALSMGHEGNRDYSITPKRARGTLICSGVWPIDSLSWLLTKFKELTYLEWNRWHGTYISKYSDCLFYWYSYVKAKYMWVSLLELPQIPVKSCTGSPLTL